MQTPKKKFCSIWSNRKYCTYLNTFARGPEHSFPSISVNCNHLNITTLPHTSRHFCLSLSPIRTSFTFRHPKPDQLEIKNVPLKDFNLSNSSIPIIPSYTAAQHVHISTYSQKTPYKPVAVTKCDCHAPYTPAFIHTFTTMYEHMFDPSFLAVCIIAQLFVSRHTCNNNSTCYCQLYSLQSEL